MPSRMTQKAPAPAGSLPRGLQGQVRATAKSIQVSHKGGRDLSTQPVALPPPRVRIGGKLESVAGARD